MHLSLLLIATCLVTLESAAPDSPSPSFKDPSSLKDNPEHMLNIDPDILFKMLQKQYDKKYGSEEEEQYRRNIFKSNLEKMNVNNDLYSKGVTTFTMGINQFSDMYSSEVVEQRTGFIPPTVSATSTSSKLPKPGASDPLPLEVDWRSKGYVTSVKDQGSCGSCWAFSALASLEGQHFKKTGNLVELSEQQLLDCSRSFGNLGCTGGSPAYAFNYIASTRGVDTFESYPYTAREGPVCKYDPATVVANCTSYKTVQASELALMSAVATVGPIAVPMDASLFSFQSYSSGVYDDAACSSTRPNHAITIVGYGSSSGLDYWIAKNSWGEGWGMNGYIYMSRNKNNQCGVASYATYPVV